MPSLPVTFMASSRFLVGASSLVIPKILSNMIAMPINSSAILPLRLFGVREAVLAAALWTANSKELTQQALIAVAVVDAIDVLSVVVSIWEGNLDVGFPAAFTAFGALFFLAIELWALSELKGQSASKLK